MTPPLETERWQAQQQAWPQQGHQLLAHYDDTTIVVYQAYRPAIAEFAVRHGHFGGEFRLNRPLAIIDLTGFVTDQRKHRDAGRLDLLETPIERLYLPGGTPRGMPTS